MKQKIVLKLQMNDAKSRCKAMKVVVSLPGVVSASLEGEDKNKIVVVGEGVDSIALTRLLRKTMGFAELVSVMSYDEKKKQEDQYKHDKETGNQPIVWASQPGVPHNVYEVHETTHDPCSIM